MERDELALLLAKEDWEEVHARLVKFGKKRGASDAMAHDLAQEAITRVFAFDSAWDPERHPVLLAYLMGVVRTLLFNERRRGRWIEPHDHHADEDDGDHKEHRDPRAFDAERVADADLSSRKIALLRARLAKNGQSEALRVLELWLDGVETPGDLAEATGWTLGDAIKFRLRMQRAAIDVADDLAGDARDEEVR